MARTVNEQWERLIANRAKRLAAHRKKGSHPLAHIEPLKAYEWMLAECAAANAQRQAREDGLISTITQISSAALLAIPGVVFASAEKLPSFSDDPYFYLGLLAFGFALVGAMSEQYFSGLAYAKHIEKVQDYYLLDSEETEDRPSRTRVRRVRWVCYSLFAIALLLTTLGLLILKA